MIFVTHGVLSSHGNDRISHALCLPKTWAVRHLKARRKKYVSLAQAIGGKGDALTVDDATFAGFELCMLARQQGHAVSWFVNGSHVENGIPYFPFQISRMIDDTRAVECGFDGGRWNLGTVADRRFFRGHIKQIYMGMTSQSEISELVKRLATVLKEDEEAEPALRTVGAAELATAVLAGVDLQNHGWSHLNPQVLSEDDCRDEIRRNEAYLAQFRRTRTAVFAPPFGQRVLRESTAQYVLLANRSLGSDYREGSVINRRHLTATYAAARFKRAPISKRQAA